jgi:hypothetical protein
MTGAPLSIGFYSIGARLPVPALLEWAARLGAPYVHLRGGRRGHRLAERDGAELAQWRRLARRTVPITLVTADAELADVLAADPAALRDLDTIRRQALAVGAARVRLLATKPPTRVAVDPRVLGGPCPVVAELHSAAWFAPPGLALAEELLGGSLLVDSAQFARHAFGDLAERLIAQARVVHLSESGQGFTGPGHRLVADAALRNGRELEVAYEWTGADRSPGTAAERYRRAAEWFGGLRCGS